MDSKPAPSETLRRTSLFEAHQGLGAKLVDFAGWEMPIQYPAGILTEHLETRRSSGLFDVSHMGRFAFHGPGAREFLQRLLTQDVERLVPGRAIYSLIADESGGTVDDCYLYMLEAERFALVVNAANAAKDMAHIERLRNAHTGADFGIEDYTADSALLALQGPCAERALAEALARLGIEGALPASGRNNLARMRWSGNELTVCRTGYTGEPIGFEIFVDAAQARALWDALLACEPPVHPVGLGARNTLRTEAGLPLYGDELSERISGLAAGLHQVGIRLVDTRSDFVGRRAMLEEYLAQSGHRVYRFAMEGRGRTPRSGDAVFLDDARIGTVTSAQTVPYWLRDADGEVGDESAVRRLGFALIDARPRIGFRRGADRRFGDVVDIRQSRPGKPDVTLGQAEIVLEFGRPSLARKVFVPVIYAPHAPEEPASAGIAAAEALVRGARENHLWRQRACMNLIPSENTPSDFVLWASARDPSGRYAEHQRSGGRELYYYQGTDWIQEVEERLCAELRELFGAVNVEPRPISGQMANETVFEALVRFNTWRSRTRSGRIRRLSRVFNNDLALGGHLSAQASGALYNYVEVDERGRPAVTNIPVRADYPYAADVERLCALIEAERPELIVLGKSMVIEPEPVAAVRAVLDTMPAETRPLLMYDMAHVLGLCGPLFQQPFAEGADVVTGSTHKTFFGPQRGVLMTGIDETYGRRRFLMDFIARAAFPGAVSNHHLGTLQGMLAAAIEWRAHGPAYQRAIHDNARAFARALADGGLKVEGDAERGYTQTHQVLVDVGSGNGRAVAPRLERNNIVCNFQGLPGDPSFSASRGLRLGVQEMTRFGMAPSDFEALAELMADCVLRDASVGDAVARLREGFRTMRYCFEGLELDPDR